MIDLSSFEQIDDDCLSRIIGASCGDNIRYYRESEEMTQRQLAQQLFVSQQTIHKWEHDINEPNLGVIRRMKEIFHKTADDIID